MDRIVDLLTLAGVLALVALPVAVLVIGALVWINRRRAAAVKDWAWRHGELKRRLADVEALRKGDPAPSVEVEDAIGMVRSTALDPDGVITITADLTPRGRHRLEELGIIPFHMALSGVTSREQAERLARHRDPCRVPPAGWDCTRVPGHDGPCATIPAAKRPAHGGYPG